MGEPVAVGDAVADVLLHDESVMIGDISGVSRWSLLRRSSSAAAVLGQILDASAWARVRATLVYRKERASLHRTLHVIVIPDLVNRAIVAAKVDGAVVKVRSESTLNLRCGVRGVAAGRDASSRKPVICG